MRRHTLSAPFSTKSYIDKGLNFFRWTLPPITLLGTMFSISSTDMLVIDRVSSLQIGPDPLACPFVWLCWLWCFCQAQECPSVRCSFPKLLIPQVPHPPHQLWIPSGLSWTCFCFWPVLSLEVTACLWGSRMSCPVLKFLWVFRVVIRSKSYSASSLCLYTLRL